MLAVIGISQIILRLEAIGYQNSNKSLLRNYSKYYLSCCNRSVMARLRYRESPLDDLL